MITCTGKGDGGGHCCYIDGQVCQFLNVIEGVPRCTVWDKMGAATWKNAPVGLWFEKNHPGYNCKDWPQNIPEVMKLGIGLCCWSGGNE